MIEAPTVADAINEAHAAAIGAGRSALEHARRAGALLLQQKAALRHGAWLPWLAEHCPTLPDRTAQAYMRIAREWPALEAKAQRVADLPLREAVKLLTAPREAPAEDGAELDTQGPAWMAELRTLDRALQSPDLTIEEAGWIARRAEQIAGDAYAGRVRALAALGRTLHDLEGRLGVGLDDIRAAGEALGHIRDQRLYRETHATFDAYVADRWGERAPLYTMAMAIAGCPDLTDEAPRADDGS